MFGHVCSAASAFVGVVFKLKMNRSSDKLLKFLFEDSQVASDLESLQEELAEAAAAESLSVKKSPLVTALKALDLDVSNDQLCDGDGCYVFTTDSADEYRAFKDALKGVDGLTALAKEGWLASFGDDEETTSANESKFNVFFIDIQVDEFDPDEEDPDFKLDDNSELEKLAKDSYEFVNEPFDDGKKDEEVKTEKGNQPGVGKKPESEKPKMADKSK